MKKKTKIKVKVKGFAIIEIIISIAIISIFIAYFGVYSNFSNNNIRETKHRSAIMAVAREIIEKSSSNGQLIDFEKIKNDNNIEISIDKIEEKSRYIKYEMTLKDVKGKEYKYVFSIDKRTKKESKGI
mgnify:CR=1 FL=1